MPKLLDFDDHMMELLKDPNEAANYLAACLEDAVKDEDDSHFVHAVLAVSKSTGKNLKETLTFLHTHAMKADFPNVSENLDCLMARLMQKMANKDLFQAA